MQQTGGAAIVHTHGPKPELALCIIDYLSQHVSSLESWKPLDVLHIRAKVVAACGMRLPIYTDEILAISAAAFKVTSGSRCCCCLRAPAVTSPPLSAQAAAFAVQVDGGEMYRWVLQEQNRLCRGACWQVGNSSEHTLRHAKAPEGATAFAVCPASRIASIVLPVFGQLSHGNRCNATTSYSVVRSLCLGSPSCAVPARRGLFGDPVRARGGGGGGLRHGSGDTAPPRLEDSACRQHTSLRPRLTAVPQRRQVSGVCVHVREAFGSPCCSRCAS